MKRIIFFNDPKLVFGKHSLYQIDFMLENTGIHGGSFFLFSYGFIGSVSKLHIRDFFVEVDITIITSRPIFVQVVGMLIAYLFLTLQLSSKDSCTHMCNNDKNI